jgi:hypothetical protein
MRARTDRVTRRGLSYSEDLYETIQVRAELLLIDK